MESMLNLRVHIAAVGFEIDRVVIPAVKMKADLVYLLADDNIATDKSTRFQTEIVKQLKKKKIDSKIVYANRLQLFDIIRVVKEIILDHRNDEFYVNVASGSKIHAIACMMACMVFDDRKKKFKNKGATVTIHDRIKFAFRISSKKSFAIEATQTSAAAQLGKVPVNIVTSAFPNVERTVNNWNGFTGSELTTIKTMFDKLTKSKLVDDKGSDWDSFSTGMSYLASTNYSTKILYAQKCIAMNYCYDLINSKNPNQIMTRFYLGAQKKGDDFGPFIKIS
jgi:hypothetical protein